MNDRITINVGQKLLDRAIPIGRVGENIVSEIEWNIGVWQEQFGDGILELLVQRNRDTNPYPVALTIDGNSAVWIITDTDTAVNGRGQLQLVYRVGEKIKKSVIYEFICRVSLGATGPVPDGYSDWLDALTQIAAQAQESAQTAQESAQEAQESAEAAGSERAVASSEAYQAQLSARAASLSEQNADFSAYLAQQSANSASASAQTANEKAEAANQSAQDAGEANSMTQSAAYQAQIYMRNAKTYKLDASSYAGAAQGYAQTATTKATEAELSANTASGFANNASASAQSANASAQAAAQSAEQAASSVADVEASAQAASQSAQLAESAKQAAQTAESNAQGFAQTASEKASQAAESAAQAQASADRANVDLLRFLPTDSASGAVASFTDGADNVPLKSLVVGITGGATECTVTHVGKNLWGKNLIQGNVLIDNLVVGKKYSATAKLKNPNQGTYFYIQKAPKGTEQRTTVGYVIAAKETYVVTFTVADGFDYYCYSNASYTNVTDIQIEEGSATEYEPYNATEIPISFGTEIQNGALDVLTGALTDTDTQTEYQIEAHEVKSLLGSNTFYVDTGDTSVEYRADIQKWVEKKLSTRSTVSLTRSMPVQTEDTDTELLQ